MTPLTADARGLYYTRTREWQDVVRSTAHVGTPDGEYQCMLLESMLVPVRVPLRLEIADLGERAYAPRAIGRRPRPDSRGPAFLFVLVKAEP